MVDWRDGGNNDSIDMDAMLRNINKALQTFWKRVEKGEKVFVDMEAQLVKITTKLGLEHATMVDNHKLKAQENRIRHAERIENDNIHALNVRRNKEFAHALAGSTRTITFVKDSLTKGRGIGETLNLFTNSIFNATKKVHDFNKASAAFKKDPSEENLTSMNERQKVMKAQQETQTRFTKKIVNSLSKAGNYFERHKAGLILGAGFAGVLVGIITKALSVAPMFQAMMKLFTFAMTMLLMPIGTFIGAMIKPLVMSLIQTIAPNFSNWMKWSMAYGARVGDFIMDPLNATGKMFEDAVGGDSTAQAGLAVLGVGGLTTALIIKKGLGGLLGKGGGGVGGAMFKGGVSSTATLGKTGLGIANIIKNALGVGKIGSAAGAGFGAAGLLAGGGGKLANISGITLAGNIAEKLSGKLGLGIVGKIGLATAFKAIPIVGWATMATAAIGSGLKELSPDSYQGLRDATSFLQFGDNDIIRDILGIGETTFLEDIKSLGAMITGSQEGMVGSAEHGQKMMETMESALSVMSNEHAPEMESDVRVMLQYYKSMKMFSGDQLTAAAQTAGLFEAAYKTVKAKISSWVSMVAADESSAKRKQAQQALFDFTNNQAVKNWNSVISASGAAGWGSLQLGGTKEAPIEEATSKILKHTIVNQRFLDAFGGSLGNNKILDAVEKARVSGTVGFGKNELARQRALDSVANKTEMGNLMNPNWKPATEAQKSLYEISGGLLGTVHGFADGGWIREPVIGIGRNSGQTYNIGERGAEYVSPSGGKSGNIIINIAKVEKDVDLNKLKPMIQRWILEANSRRGMI